jgi:hypothetical protein
MKRIFLTSIIGIAAAMTVTSSYAQGNVWLDNYSDNGGQVTYGGGPYQIPGTIVGSGVANGTNGTLGNVTWTVGIYYALGDVTGSITPDPSGMADPATLGGGLQFLSGNPFDTTTFNRFPGYFSGGVAVIPGYTSGLVTFEAAAFNGSSWSSSMAGGHSAPFTLYPSVGAVAPPPISEGTSGMQTFSVYLLVPEPSLLSLSGMGAAAMLLVRRRKN